jgi:hypothetical protein
MRQMQGVLWTKGLLLSPQHLQLQDRYFEDQLGFHLGALSRYPWGFSELTVDPEALEGGILSVPKAAGIMEDGLLFDFPEADPAPDSKAFGIPGRGSEREFRGDRRPCPVLRRGLFSPGREHGGSGTPGGGSAKKPEVAGGG